MKIWLLLVDHKFQAMGNRFDVDSTSEDDNVSTLKKKVKEEIPEALSRAHVDPSDLTVWKTKGPLVIKRSNIDLLTKTLKRINVDDRDTIEVLDPEVRVVELGLSHGQTLLVQLPNPKVITNAGDDDSEPVIMKIWLLLVNHKFQAMGNCFDIDSASEDDNINTLKEKVKEEIPEALSRAHVDPSDLTVWKTKGSMAIDESNFGHLAEILGSIDVDNRDTIEKLSEVEQVANLKLSDTQILLIRLPAITLSEDNQSETSAQEGY
ncbi:hypothetical protein H4582DRAFT_1984398 [Lactarius indigo]|nr:hypothetical protein H4582DRAFT_1984398 [Lactarius indigo]